VDASWYSKYGRRFGYPRETLSKEAIVSAAEEIGRDGIVLLERIWSEDAPLYLRSLPAVETKPRALTTDPHVPRFTLLFHTSGPASRHCVVLIIPQADELCVPQMIRSGESSPGESHPEALSEPYLNLSAHTAPAMEPRRSPICQCAHNFGSRLEIRATQCVALRKWPRSFLYFR
jgi:hypothetical protein